MNFVRRTKSRERGLAQLAILCLATAGLVVVGAAPAHAVDELTSIDVDTWPRATAFTPDGVTAFVTNSDSDTVSVIDVATSAVVDTISVGDSPHGVSVTPDGELAYVANLDDDDISIIDVASNTVVDSITGIDGPFGIVFTANGSKAYVSNYVGGGVTVVDVATATVTKTITGIQGPEGMALNPDGSRLFVASTIDFVGVIDTTTDTVVGPLISTGDFTTDVVFTPDGEFVYASNNGSDDVSVIDVSTLMVVETIATGHWPIALAISEDGSKVFVTIDDDESVAVIDVATNTLDDPIAVGTGPGGITISPNGNVMYVANRDSGTISVIGDPVTRESGSNRYATAIAVSQQAFPGTADVVYIATGADYPDALSAGPAAAAEGGPLLLTAGTSLPAAVKAEIQRLSPARIVVVGGTGAVSAGVFNQLALLAPDIERVSGSSRYATSREIAEYAFGSATLAYVATGANFPDALSAAAAGANEGAPVILVDGSKASVDSATLQLLASLGIEKVKIVGGTGVVSPGIQTQLSALYATTRLSGANRYATSLAVTTDAFPTTAPRVLLSTGTNFPDALAGSAWAGMIRGPLLVVEPTCVPAGTLAGITALDPLQVTLLGGTGALSAGVFALTEC
jgi:YVTN family beta-propeller protein